MDDESPSPADANCTSAESMVTTQSSITPRVVGLKDLQARTPARILTGRAGPAYRTTTWLELRRDHAAARDAITRELNLAKDFETTFIAEWGLFEVSTLAGTKQDFLRRPELGRSFSDATRLILTHRCLRSADFQVAIADGLSAMAVRVQIPLLLPQIAKEATAHGWRFGQPFVIRYGRVGILNEIGEILDPTVTVLLIGERPGLATAESLSAYMAYRPRIGHDDARRNLISNIHASGVTHERAAHRIALYATQMMERQASGVMVKEEWPSSLTLPSAATCELTPES
jgi:ethanolamine ammonia-lyase small subunit